LTSKITVTPALPPEPIAGESLRASWGAQLIRWARANTLLPTPGMLLSRTANGTSFRPQATPTVSSAAAAVSYPWQPYLSPWQGTGVDPDASTRALRFRLIGGQCASRTPTNMTAEQLAFGDPTDTEIEEADAVVTQIYLQVPLSEMTLGDGGLLVARPTINIIEGEDLIDALTGNGQTPPTGGSNGSLPAYIVISLGEVSWWGGVLHLPPGFGSYINIALANAGGCMQTQRSFIITGGVAQS
jgi:hypothetical protein